MKKPLLALFFAAILGSLLIFTPPLRAQGTTAFTYQGQLNDGGTNANGVYTMTFELFDSVSGGAQIGSAITNSASLANGLFTVNLDFGAGAFNGACRWLDITVQNGSVSQELSPRVQVLPSPYALYASSAGSASGVASGSWSESVGTYQGLSNLFLIYANGSLAMGITTNSIFAPSELEVNSNLSVKGDIDAHGDLGVQGDIEFFGTNQIINFDGSGGSIAGNPGQSGIQITTAGSGLTVDGNFASTSAENLAILRGHVNPGGGVNSTNFSATYIPPGTGGSSIGLNVTLTPGNNTFTVANDQSGVFPIGLWLEMGNGLYQVTSVSLNNLQGGGVTSTVQFLPGYNGSSWSGAPIRNMTLYPSYTVQFTNVFSSNPTVIISGSGGWPTQQGIYPNYSILSWTAFQDYSQPVTPNSFGVMLYSPGAQPSISSDNGFDFVAIGPR